MKIDLHAPLSANMHAYRVMEKFIDVWMLEQSRTNLAIFSDPLLAENTLIYLAAWLSANGIPATYFSEIDDDGVTKDMFEFEENETLTMLLLKDTVWNQN